MIQQDALELFRDRFSGRGDLYLLESGTQVSWWKDSVTDDVLVSHLLGSQRIGLAAEAEGVRFAACDFDGKRDDGQSRALDDARRFLAELGRLQIQGLLELSRSGRGYHVWVLFSPEDLPTLDEARSLLKRALHNAGLPSDGLEQKGHPGIFPHPPGKKRVGRAPFLPWCGVLRNGTSTATFVDLDGETLADQLQALRSADRVSRERVLKALAEMKSCDAAGVEVVTHGPSKVNRRYGQVALERETEAVRETPEGGRNERLNKAAFSLGQLVGGGVLQQEVVAENLHSAAMDAGLTESESQATVRSGIEAGRQSPRWPSQVSSGAASDEQRGDAGNCTDAGNARRFAEQHGADAKYTIGRGWTFWDGKRWTPDDTNEAMRRAKATADSIWNEVLSARDTQDQKALARHALKSHSATSLRNMIFLAQSELEVARRDEDFDHDKMLFNVANGTIDLRTGMLRPHDRADLIRKYSAVAYDADAKCPRWDQFLDEILAGDGALIEYIQRAMGYTLTGMTGEQVFFTLYGEGANGKSVLQGVMRKLFGDYGQTANIESFMTGRTHGSDASPDIAVLAGARCVMASEGEAGRQLSESRIKALTGEDSIRARFLYHDGFEFKPQFKIWIATNHKPAITGQDHAIWRRVQLVPFLVRFEGKAQDKALAAKLATELPGILAWVVRGCLGWQSKGLATPEAVRAATDEYREEEDVVGAFLSECCDVDLDSTWTTLSADLYSAYVDWVKPAKPITRRALGDGLGAHGLDRGRTPDKKRNGLWRGVRLIGQGSR